MGERSDLWWGLDEWHRELHPHSENKTLALEGVHYRISYVRCVVESTYGATCVSHNVGTFAGGYNAAKWEETWLASYNPVRLTCTPIRPRRP